jgi:hypothetical protein
MSDACKKCDLALEHSVCAECDADKPSPSTELLAETDSARINRHTSVKIAHDFLADEFPVTQELLADAIFTALQIAQKRGEILARLDSINAPAYGRDERSVP